MAKKKSELESATEKLTEDEYEALTSHHLQVGMATGRENGIATAKHKILEDAAKLFMDGKDDLAERFRRLAKEVGALK